MLERNSIEPTINLPFECWHCGALSGDKKTTHKKHCVMPIVMAGKQPTTTQRNACQNAFRKTGHGGECGAG